MPVASEWLLQISNLSSGNTAAQHFLSVEDDPPVIEQPIVQIFGELVVEMDGEFEVVLEAGQGVILEDDHSIILSPEMSVEYHSDN